MSSTNAVAAPSPTNPEPVAPSRRRLVLQVLFATVLALALVALFWPRAGGRTVPGGFLIDAEGRPAPLAPRLAPVSLVHFWATWCPPCLEEIPALERLAADFADQPRFRVVLVAVDDSVSQVEGFLSPGRAATMLYDPEWAIARQFGTDMLPESHVVVSGDIVESFVGATDWDDPAVRSRLEERIRAPR